MKTESSIEESVNSSTQILDSLHSMAEYRYWSQTTLQSYVNDVKKFEEFLMEQNINPELKNGEKIYLVNKWIKVQKENGDAYKTICRRIASLSSIYNFYKDLGILKVNAFKAAVVPGSHTGSHSSVLDLDEMKQVYGAIQELKKEGIDIEIPIKLLIFTGLRNQALCLLKVKNVKWDEGLLVYDSGVDNSKHKVQILPLPPKLVNHLKEFVAAHSLEPDDPLCHGLQGKPLQNKQLNRITDKICDHLGFIGDRRVTPHGFRYSISTLLDEKGVSRDNIKYLLGHSERENIQYYIKRDKRKIFQIKKVLTEIEDELENSLIQNNVVEEDEIDGIYVNNNPEELSIHKNPAGNRKKNALPFSEELLLQLSKSNPDLLEKIFSEYFATK